MTIEMERDGGGEMDKKLNQNRRLLLKAGVSSATLALAVSSGLLLPRQVIAHWPKEAFSAQSVEDALSALIGKTEPMYTGKEVQFKTALPPSYAVNGASVPIEIHSDLDDIERVVILVEKNPVPLIMSAELTKEMVMPFKTMIKIAEDSNVIAVVCAGGKLYSTTRFVEVDIGGCG